MNENFYCAECDREFDDGDPAFWWFTGMSQSAFHVRLVRHPA